MKIMEKKIFCVLFLSFLLIMSSICIAGEPVAERPVYSKGDKWTFVDHKEIKVEFEFQREDNGKYIFKRNGEEIIRDFELTIIKKKKNVGYPGPIIKFPLEVGKKWTYKYRKKMTTGDPKKDSRRVTYKVESYEPVTVPAGTFQSYKIRATTEKHKKKTVSMEQTVIYWYAPEVKQIVKKDKRVAGKFSVLTDYKIK